MMEVEKTSVGMEEGERNRVKTSHFVRGWVADGRKERKKGAEEKEGRRTEKYIQSSRDFSLLIYRANFYFSGEILKPVVPAI